MRCSFRVPAEWQHSVRGGYRCTLAKGGDKFFARQARNDTTVLVDGWLIENEQGQVENRKNPPCPK
jgi:hypothetical protein